MGYAQEWKQAKETFEKAAGKKKPSANFLGVFHRSGLEDAAKALDVVLGKKDENSFDKILKEYSRAATSYKLTLDKSIKAEKAESMAANLKDLKAAIDRIEEDAEATFDKEKTKIRGEKAIAIADKALMVADAELKAAFAEGRVLDKAFADAGSALILATECQQSGKAKEAKQAAASVFSAAKTVEAQAKKVASKKDKIGEIKKKAADAIAKFDIDLTDPKGPTRPVNDKFDILWFSLDDYCSRANEKSREAWGLVENAKEALQGTLDLLATYRGTCQKIEERAQEAVRKYDATTREMEGKRDQIKFDAMNAETAEPEKKAELIRACKGRLPPLLKMTLEAAKEITPIIKDLEKSLNAVPAAAAQDKPCADMMSESRNWITALKDSVKSLGITHEWAKGFTNELKG